MPPARRLQGTGPQPGEGGSAGGDVAAGRLGACAGGGSLLGASARLPCLSALGWVPGKGRARPSSAHRAEEE